jgi:hypothetical protein
MSRFIRDEAIQLKAKFALANLIKSHHLRVLRDTASNLKSGD